jgi:hypothetical protein
MSAAANERKTIQLFTNEFLLAILVGVSIAKAEKLRVSTV